MSKQLANAYGVDIASFAGGKGRGPCVQILGPSERKNEQGIVQLDRTQVEFVRDVLSKWLGDKKVPALDPHSTDAGDAF